MKLINETNNRELSSYRAHCESLQDAPFIWDLHQINRKGKGILRAQQSWVHSFNCNIHDFHMKKEESILIAGTLVHSLFLYGAISALYIL